MRHFINTFAKLRKRGVVGCEVGVYSGDHAVSMFDGIKLKELHLVDNYKDFENPEIKEIVYAAIKKLKDKPTTFHFQASVDVAKKFPDGYFDFVYIDATHDYKNVIADIRAWYPKVKKDGYLAGHDWAMGDVKKAVNEFVKKMKIKTLKHDDDPREGGNEDWYFQK